jgi:hypothetical protein
MPNNRHIPFKFRNPIARDLATNKYHQRVVKSRKLYNRKREKQKEYNDY